MPACLGKEGSKVEYSGASKFSTVTIEWIFGLGKGKKINHQRYNKQGSRDKAEGNAMIKVSADIVQRTWNFPVRGERFGQ